MRGLLVTAGGFSLINKRVKEALSVAAPDFEWIHFDAAKDTFRDSLKAKLISQFIALIHFAPIIAKQKIPPQDLMVRVPYFQKCLSRALKTAAVDCDFTLQTQSLFDARVPGISNFLYTDHTHLANQRYEPRRLTWPVSRSWLEMEKSLYSGSRVCFSTSHFAANSIVEDYGVPRERVAVVFSGCNAGLPSSVVRPDRIPRRIIFVGVEWERKGGPVLLDSFIEVRKQYPDACLDIVGCSPDVSVEGVKIYGRVESECVPAFLERADIFALPSLAEPSAAALVEASAFGLPVIATRVGGSPERLIDGTTGILVRPNDTGDLSEAIIRLMRNQTLAKEMGANGREFAMREFTWAAVAEKMANRLRCELK